MPKRLEKIKEELSCVQSWLAALDRAGLGNDSDLVREEQCLRESFDSLLDDQEVYWAQRAKEKWMVLGERNTSYFHKVASVCARRNRIVCLKNDAGELVMGHEETHQLILDHFLNLFQGTFCRDETASLLEPCSIISEGTVGAQLLSNLGVRLSDSQIRELEAPFSEAEIRDAIFQMKGMKAPGPDGFVAGFY